MGKRYLASFWIAGAMALASYGASAAEMPDLILRHGTILDGTGAPRFQADIAVSKGRIAAIGDLSRSTAKQEIDVTGLFVAPGFINIHDHPSIDGLVRAENMLTQGVTTELFNPDGGAPAGTNPISVSQQLAQLSAHGLGTNIGGYIGFNSVWEAVVGTTDRRPVPAEIAGMQDLLTRNLEAGAFGVSAGLDYKPGYYATTNEVIAVVRAASKWRTNFPNHERLTPENGFSSIAGMTETIKIAETAGIAPEITHLKIQGHEQGRASEVLAMMDAATARGHYTPADAYPYVAGSTGLGAVLLPAWALEGGRPAFLERARDPALRKKMGDETNIALAKRFSGPDNVLLPTMGKKLSAIMAEEKIDSPGEAIIRLLEKADTRAVLFFGAEPDLVKFLTYPGTAIACDCGAVAGRPPGHPRSWGTFPRVLGRYVREQNIMSWETAISKMGGIPASTIGLVDRGILGVGMIADITVFDPATVIDHATYEEPTLPSEGIRHVLVNGTLAVRDGKPTDAQAGLPLRRTQHMPTRKLVTGDRSVAGSFAVRGDGLPKSGAMVSVSLTQKTGEHHGSGSFRLTGAGRNSLSIAELGVLQVAKGWASFSGRARFADGSEKLVTVILDAADPLAAAKSGSVTIDGEAFHLAGVAPSATMKVAFER